MSRTKRGYYSKPIIQLAEKKDGVGDVRAIPLKTQMLRKPCKRKNGRKEGVELLFPQHFRRIRASHRQQEHCFLSPSAKGR
jgi:hypothetical protein